MRTIIVLVVMMAPAFFRAQQPYAENAWGSLVWNHRWNRGWQTTFDAGYRSCDGFIRQRRQTLMRAAITHGLGKHWFIGGGFAWFRHTRPGAGKTAQEYRPFIQVNCRYAFGKWQLASRIRQEFRGYPSQREIICRSRFQVSVSRMIVKRWLNPVFSAEGFVSATKEPLIESRLLFGNTIGITRHCKILPFYTLQKQSSINGNQHIIGLQLIFDTGNDDQAGQ
jgi:hypothetical protein